MDFKLKNGTGLNGLLSTKAAADYLGLELRRIQRLLNSKNKKKRIPHYKIENRFYCKKEDLDNWFERQRVE